MNYINTLIPIAANAEIIEYDIRSANTSIVKEYNLLPGSDIDKLETMDKEDRVVIIGKIMRSNKQFAKDLEAAFNDIITKFIEKNKLSKETDIISIKRDAVFVLNKNINYTSFGHVNFIAKNIYDYYVQLKRLEFYGTHGSRIDVKGIPDDVLSLHKDGMLKFIDVAVEEYEMKNKKMLIKFFKEFCDMYKKKELDFDYYREFSSDSKFKITSGKRTLSLDNMSESFIENLDISYNYTNIVLPTLRLLNF